MKKDLQAVSKVLKQLIRKTEQMVKKVDGLSKANKGKKTKVSARAKARPAKKAVVRKAAKAKASPAKKTVVRKAAKGTAIDVVMNAIGRSRKSITTAQISAKTGFKNKKIWDNVNRLKQQGRVKSAGKGVYVKA
ncbi:MAG: hypothetical protein JRJ65_18170 [Deltaproteobacteria bacterium]|nr:hypothetical protein [Deltaproteobacteria bacterium]